MAHFFRLSDQHKFLITNILIRLVNHSLVIFVPDNVDVYTIRKFDMVCNSQKTQPY